MSYGGDYHRGELVNIVNWVLTGAAIGSFFQTLCHQPAIIY